MKKWWLALAAVLLIAIGGAAYWFFAIPPTAVPNGSQSLARFAPGPYRVLDEDFRAVDDSRPTPANGDTPAHPGRELVGEIWRPAHLDEPGPLVVYSHGFMSYHRESLYLARFLASHGYTMIAVDYPLTSLARTLKPRVTDVANQPGDVSFLIDTLLARNLDSADPLYRSIDPQRIAAVGLSLGGLTSTLVAFHRRLRDPRIAAAVSIAGPASVLTGAFFTDTQKPYLLVHGESDVIAPYARNALPVLAARPGTILVTLKNASHTGFAQPAAIGMRFMDNPDRLGCKAVLKGLAEELAGQQRAMLAVLGDAADGINLDAQVEVCASTPPAKVMPAARQQMFTALAVQAFLDSVFAPDSATRAADRDYLLHTLPQENGGEVAVNE